MIVPKKLADQFGLWFEPLPDDARSSAAKEYGFAWSKTLIVSAEFDADRASLAAERRQRSTRLIGLHDDHDEVDRDYFVALSAAEKMALVSTMFAEQWLLKGGDAEQLRLRRDRARLQRRGS